MDLITETRPVRKASMVKLVDPPKQWVRAIELGEIRPGPFSEIADLGMYDKAELRYINDDINRRVHYVREKKDYWRIADTQGDCEDIALRKREELIQYGWPIGALRLTLCFSETNGGHAVLSAITNEGVFILDNRYHGTKAPNYLTKVGYQFISRELPGSDKWENLREPTNLADLLKKPRKRLSSRYF